MLVRRIVAAAFTLVVAAPTFALAQDSAANHRRAGINARQQQQTARIKDGRQDHELTQKELNKLRADEAAIRAEERVYRRSGDGLNRWERRDLERDLNQTNREIYRAKHNRR